MTQRNTILTLTLGALAALLALGNPALATAQEEPPGLDEPRAEGRWGERPGWGPRGPGSGHHRGHRGPGIGPGMRGMGPGGPGPHGLRFALRELDLSESQREQIKSIFEGEREEVRAHHEKMRALGQELQDQIENDPYNEAAGREKAAAAAAPGGEMAVLRARQTGQVRDVLTPEQLDKLELMKEERRTFREERRDRFERRREGWSKP